MIKVVQKKLPHGVVPFSDIKDPIVKQKIMLLNQNIASLADQMANCQRALIELQTRLMRTNDTSNT